MSGKLLAVAAVAALVCGPAFAADTSLAQLGAVKGSVLVSQNGKMVSASTASLKAGDRVVASANGSASVKFADGCVVDLKPASMITVAAKSPCALGSGLVAAQAQPQQMSASTAGWVAAGAFVVVGGALVAAGDDANDGTTTSP
jgi:hypothetical protein